MNFWEATHTILTTASDDHFLVIEQFFTRFEVRRLDSMAKHLYTGMQRRILLFIRDQIKGIKSDFLYVMRKLKNQ